jgi:ankyrin repeat protein
VEVDNVDYVPSTIETLSSGLPRIAQDDTLESPRRLGEFEFWRRPAELFWRVQKSSPEGRLSEVEQVIWDQLPKTDLSEGRLSEIEQVIWDQLLKTDCFYHLPRPQPQKISPLNRGCCLARPSEAEMDNTQDNHICSVCGFTPEHREGLARLGLDFHFLCILKSGVLDSYGNTPLHTAAVYMQPGCFWQFSTMERLGPNWIICNTSGETFLHLLCYNGPQESKDIEHFVKMLKELKMRSFPLSKRDYRGRTFLHILFEGASGCTYSIETLRQILSTAEIRVDYRDNAGLTVADHLRGRWRKNPLDHHLEDLLIQYCKDDLDTVWHRMRISKMNNESILREWLPSLQRADRSLLIDGDGNTPLAAVLKLWAGGDGGMGLLGVIEQIAAQTNDDAIHIRNGDGDTLLSIAAQRGLRPVVALLLKLNSNIFVRDYWGVGILSQTERCLSRAKNSNDDKVYTAIWTCRMALIDHGAKVDPTEQDEWMTPEARRLTCPEVPGLRRG